MEHLLDTIMNIGPNEVGELLLFIIKQLLIGPFTLLWNIHGHLIYPHLYAVAYLMRDTPIGYDVFEWTYALLVYLLAPAIWTYYKLLFRGFVIAVEGK